jgi:hypothetical protein
MSWRSTPEDEAISGVLKAWLNGWVCELLEDGI